MKCSTFAIYDKEIRKININKDAKILDIQNLTKIEKYIILIIDKFKVITFDQIMKFINIEEKHYMSDEVRKNITRLLNNNIIESSDVYNSKDIKQFTFYYILNNIFINNIEITNNYNSKNLIQVKKRLQGNEIIISFLSKLKKDTFIYQIDTKLISKRFSKMFIVEGADIIIKKQEKEFNILYEIVRREKDWKKKIINKLKLYKSFYDELITENKKVSVFPQLVLVCENEEHIEELIEEMITQKCIISKIKLYISMDYLIKSDILNSIIETRIDKNNKYKKIYRKIKINNKK